MAILSLVVAPNPILQQKSLAVESITKETQQLCNDMLETMYHFQGIGLSAVQVNVLQTIIVVDISWIAKDNKKMEQFIMINPEIIANSNTPNVYNEGCLSFPSQFVEITRPKEISVKFLDINGKEQVITADGLFSTCIQHEIDHLQGKTITSYVSELKRTMMLNRIKKIKRTMENVI